MTVQRMVGAPALVEAMRRDGPAGARGVAEEVARQRSMAARRSVPTVGARPQGHAPVAGTVLRTIPAE